MIWISIDATMFLDEMSWHINDNCNSNGQLGVSSANEETPCCLGTGDHVVRCIDSWGDGWHGSSITVGAQQETNVNFCSTFATGLNEEHRFTVNSAGQVSDSVSTRCTDGEFYEIVMHAGNFAQKWLP